MTTATRVARRTAQLVNRTPSKPKAPAAPKATAKAAPKAIDTKKYTARVKLISVVRTDRVQCVCGRWIPAGTKCGWHKSDPGALAIIRERASAL